MEETITIQPIELKIISWEEINREVPAGDIGFGKITFPSGIAIVDDMMDHIGKVKQFSIVVLYEDECRFRDENNWNYTPELISKEDRGLAKVLLELFKEIYQ